jgi:hypothetical protein
MALYPLALVKESAVTKRSEQRMDDTGYSSLLAGWSSLLAWWTERKDLPSSRSNMENNYNSRNLSFILAKKATSLELSAMNLGLCRLSEK